MGYAITSPQSILFIPAIYKECDIKLISAMLAHLFQRALNLLSILCVCLCMSAMSEPTGKIDTNFTGMFLW